MSCGDANLDYPVDLLTPTTGIEIGFNLLEQRLPGTLLGPNIPTLLFLCCRVSRSAGASGLGRRWSPRENNVDDEVLTSVMAIGTGGGGVRGNPFSEKLALRVFIRFGVVAAEDIKLEIGG